MNPDPASDEWCTPAYLAAELGVFYLDPCSNSRSHVIALKKYGLEWNTDGLKELWTGSVFCNPPYSNVRPWADRLRDYEGAWAALVKLDPTTKWWREGFFGGTHNLPDWAPFNERIKFERPDKPPLTANFPCALIWNNGYTPSPALFRRLFLGHARFPC